jgi:hypothetical protein
MLREVGEAIQKALENTFNQIEFYEGQFERFDEEVVYPPACYIEYVGGEPAQNGDPLGRMNLVLHVLTSRLERSPGNMLDILEEIITIFHDKGLLDAKGAYLGRSFFSSFRNTIVHDGLVAFEVDIEVVRG